MHFLSLHNDKLSLLQSAATDIARAKDQMEADNDENAEDSAMPDMSHPIVRAFSRVCEFHELGEVVPDAPPEDDRLATDNKIELVWMCAKLYAEYFLARLEGDDAKATSLREELRYNVCDPDWLPWWIVFSGAPATPCRSTASAATTTCTPAARATTT